MGDFQFGPAFGAGFGLIRRRPLAVGVWGAAYALIAGLPPWLAPTALQIRNEGDANAVAGFVLLGSLLASLAIVPTAIYRAVLDPQSRRFFHLRLGRAELLQLLAGVAILVSFLIGYIALSAGFTLISGPSITLAGTASVALLFLVSPRFLTGGPITVAEGGFALIRAWRLTRGRWLKGLLLAAVCAAVVAVAYSGMVVAAEALSSVMDAAAAFDPVLRLGVTIGITLVGLTLVCFVLGAAMAIFFAPWAVAYRDLAGRGIDVETFA